MSTGKRFRKILVATDFSAAAAAAFQWAIEVAKLHDASLNVVHAENTFGIPLNLSPFAQKDLTEYVQRHLAGLERAAGEAGVRAVCEHHRGRPAQVIADAAGRVRPDLLMLGRFGHTDPMESLLGNTTNHVIRSAAVPVLTVHPHDFEAHCPPRTILVATDFSDEAACAANAAVALLGPVSDGARLVLLHVCHGRVEYDLNDAADVLAHLMDELREAAEPRLEEAASGLRSERLAVETVVKVGYPPVVIRQEAESEAADLIAMGTHGRSGLERFASGSVAERVLRRAICPVLTVRRDDKV